MSTFQPYAPSASEPLSGSSVSPISADDDSPPAHLTSFDRAQAKDGGIGKKIAPVKAACLSCRAKKAKCDGKQPVCGQCARKNIECLFVKSRRGGARKRRPATVPSALQLFLKKLDSLLEIPRFDVTDYKVGPNASDDPTNIVRQFSTREEVLTAYYDDVHPIAPVMPPRAYLESVLPTLQPASPFLLAAQTILVLIPDLEDPDPYSANSKRLRQIASQALAQQTNILVESFVTNGQSSLECVQALSLLSLWEWSNGNNLVKCRERASQSMQLAMDMGLHETDKHSSGDPSEPVDWQKDMARRTWWNLYAAQLLSSIVTGTPPIMSPDDPRIHVSFPTTSADDKTWPHYIQTLRSCVRVFALVNSVYYSDLVGSNWGPPSAVDQEQLPGRKSQIVDVDRQIMDLMKQAEATSIIELVPGGEVEVVRNLQMAARLGLAVLHIHIHRNQAFPEVSLFSKKMCGLPQAPDFTASPAQTATPPTVDGQSAPWSATSGSAHSGELSHAQLSHGVPSGSFQVKCELSNNGMPFDQIYTNTQNSFHNGQYAEHSYHDGSADQYDFTQEMWQPDSYPEYLPPPWFSYAGGAAALYVPVEQEPHHYPPVTATIVPINSPPEGRRSSQTSSTITNKPHKAWGVDEKADKVLPPLGSGQSEIFPPGISLARCATAAHTIVRLEVLHRSAAIAMSNHPPRWAPFCSCGLVTGAYAFLLLALAVQAENTFEGYTDSRSEEVEALLTNVRVILAGLEGYGRMWAGIDAMAGEVRAALEAAARLPFEIENQSEATPPFEEQSAV